MDESQADAVARAILDPDVKAQEELRQKRAAEARSLAQRRRVAWFALAGFVLSAVTAYFTKHDIVIFGLWGGIAGAAVGWLFKRRA